VSNPKQTKDYQLVMPDTHPTEESPAKMSIHPIFSMLMIIKNIVLILIGSYGLSVSLHIVLHFVIGERSTIVALFNTFAHLMWMPALVLFPLMLLTKQWRIALMLVLPALMFIVTYGGLFIPRQSVPPLATSQTITLQTHNLLARNRTPQNLLDVIREISADVVALQEVSVSLEQRLLTLNEYPYMAIHGTADEGTFLMRETMGQAVLSRYPILEDEYWTYNFLPIPLAHQRVVIDVDEQHIVIYNIHPSHPGMASNGIFFDASLRQREFADLLNRIQSETLPVILIGDFNLTDLSLEYSQISSQLTDTHREVGQGLGYTFPDFREAFILDSMEIIPDNFPEHLPIPLLMRLDYVFHSEEFTGVTTYVHHTSGGSDHRPLVVTLALDMAISDNN
jgi:vancomycin resistance protein VanJ